jgi:altronate dehydratase large subunit
MNYENYRINNHKIAFEAYVRRDRGGIVGTRNHVVIIPTVFCANKTAIDIEAKLSKLRFGPNKENRVVSLQHYGGCCQIGFDEDVARRTLTNIGRHPNVGGVLLISLGCSRFCKEASEPDLSQFRLYNDLKNSSMHNIDFVSIQESGSHNAVSEGVEKAKKLVEDCQDAPKKMVHGFRKIVLGVLNGASDPTSGLFANPSVGYLSDALVNGGGTCVFSQTTELYGAEQYLETKCVKKFGKLKRMIYRSRMIEESLKLMGELQVSQPTPGNIRSGISTIGEKAMGNVFKAGLDPNIKIKEVLPITKRIRPIGGLYFMDGPGQDLINMTGMIAGGTQVIVFTTGMGTPLGSPIAPVIKVTANRRTFETMKDYIDVYIPKEKIFLEKKKLKEISLEAFFPYFTDILAGKKLTKSEENDQRDFEIREMWMKI